MSTVCKNDSISKSDIQEILELNAKKLGIDSERIEYLIAVVKKRKVIKQMRKDLYNQILKIIAMNKQLNRKGKHINAEERSVIQVLIDAKFSYNFIAKLLDRNRSSIKREFDRNAIKIEQSKKLPSKTHPNIRYKSVYFSQKAQEKYKLRREKCRKLRIYDKHPEIVRYIKQMMKEKNVWGADIYAHMINSGKVGINAKISRQTIYNCAKEGYQGISMICFPHGSYKQKSANLHNAQKTTPERKKDHSIELLSDEIKNSITYFEGDSVVGKREGTHNTVLTFANPKTKFYIIKRSQNKTCKATCEVLDNLEKEMNGKNLIENILFDNGIEFSDFDAMEKSIETTKKRFNVYYAHAYTSCERGCNENKNRELRRFIPKGKNIEELSDEYLNFAMMKINNKPRKSLGYKSSLEVYEAELKKKNIDTCFLDKYRDSSNLWKKTIKI